MLILSIADVDVVYYTHKVLWRIMLWKINKIKGKIVVMVKWKLKILWFYFFFRFIYSKIRTMKCLFESAKEYGAGGK